MTTILRPAIRGVLLYTAATSLLLAAPVQGQQPEVEKTWTDHTCTGSDGTRFHYVERGQGTPVILIHGFTPSAVGNWFRAGVAQKIARTIRLIGLDMRGHGGTGPSPEGSTGTPEPHPVHDTLALSEADPIVPQSGSSTQQKQGGGDDGRSFIRQGGLSRGTTSRGQRPKFYVPGCANRSTTSKCEAILSK